MAHRLRNRGVAKGALRDRPSAALSEQQPADGAEESSRSPPPPTYEEYVSAGAASSAGVVVPTPDSSSLLSPPPAPPAPPVLGWTCLVCTYVNAPPPAVVPSSSSSSSSLIPQCEMCETPNPYCSVPSPSPPPRPTLQAQHHTPVSSVSSIRSSAVAKTRSELRSSEISHITSSLASLTVDLTNFSQVHAVEIRSDPAFRAAFLKICIPLGIDPLVSRKDGAGGGGSAAAGSSAGIFGRSHHLPDDLSDFYHELSLKVMEVCLATSDRSGGVIRLTEICDILNRNDRAASRRLELAKRGTRNARGGGVANAAATAAAAAGVGSVGQQPSPLPLPDKYSGSDVLISISKLSVLGGGLRTFDVSSSSSSSASDVLFPSDSSSSETYVVSTPLEVSPDVLLILNAANASRPVKGVLTIRGIVEGCRWKTERARRAVESLVREGVCWTDVGGGGAGGGLSKEHDEILFWFPAIFFG